MTRRATASIVSLLLVVQLACVPVVARAAAPPRSIAPPPDVVKDAFFGYFLSLLRYDLTVDLSGNELLQIFPEYNDDRQTPLDALLSFRRVRDGSGSEVDVLFDGPLDCPAPIDVLGMHPVMLRGTESISVREVRVTLSTADVNIAYMLFIDNGTLLVDFAPWLDFLLGSFVDDVQVDVVYALQYDGTWYGVMAGRNPLGRPMTGVYDMRRGRFLARPARAITDFALEHMRPDQQAE